MDPTALFERISTAITTPQPVPAPQTIGLLAIAAVAAIVVAWPVTRMVVTIAHEAGHGIAATLVGRQLSGIRLHSDTSGLTVSKGKPRGPGMVFTLLAGYTAPALMGLGAALVLGQGYAVGLLWGFVLLMAVMLLLIRNLFGLLVVLVGLAAVGLTSWYLEPVQQSWVAYFLTWTLLLAAPRAVLELMRQPSPTSDAGQLARLTRVPQGVWGTVFLLVTVACLVGGLALMTPAVLSVL